MGLPPPRPARRVSPKTMKSKMATTLIMANQYSKLPKLPTLRAFTYSKAQAKPRIQSHFGVLGNHHWQ